MKPALFSGRILLTMLLMVPLAGCETMTAASSLRVEVESYRGPLTKRTEMQVAELRGIVVEACRVFKDYKSNFYPSPGVENLEPTYIKDLCQNNTPLLSETDSNTSADLADLESTISDLRSKSQAIDSILKTSKNNTDVSKKTRDNKESVAQFIQQIENDRIRCTIKHKRIRNKISPPTLTVDTDNFSKEHVNTLLDLKAAIDNALNKREQLDCRPEKLLKDLNKLNEIGTRMQTEATALAGSLMKNIPTKADRAKLASDAIRLAEYGNQISARTHQISLRLMGKSAVSIGTNQYLIESHSTDFVNMYPWFDAIDPTGGIHSTYPEKAWSDHDWYVDNASRMPATDRVRAYERLMKNNFWTTVNTVQANGAGKVRMALIKDDIGNWNLKSFAADPTELMKTYTSVAMGIGKVGAELATTGKSSALSSFSTPAKAADLTKVDQLEKARKKTHDRLSDLKRRVDEQQITDKKKITDNMDAILKNHEEMIAGIMME
ncbi:MAG: hypothetical protein HQM01_09510 [Magnetococcales bacterium]|nr:hypothetical protein [Magnetococcales bacterium]